MDDAERRVLERLLVRLLKAIYLTSLTEANVCASHARHTHDSVIAEQLAVYVRELGERREVAAELLAQRGRGRPVLRAFIYPLTRIWGRLTAMTGASFSLHMLGNMEVQGAKLTAYADKLARELADLDAVNVLVRLARAEAARKAFIVTELERIAG
jgi:ribosomal protein S11